MGSKSSLFLIEQLIVIAIFAICAAICVKIFAESYIRSSAGADINNALLVTQNAAESFKAASGDMSATAMLIDQNLNWQDGLLFTYYDKTWRSCDDRDALYRLCFTPYGGTGDEASLEFCRITVERLGEGALSGIIVELTAAARKE